MCLCFRKPFSALAFSHDGKYLVTGEVRAGGNTPESTGRHQGGQVKLCMCLNLFVCVCVSERSHAVCAGVGGGWSSGGRGSVS